MAHPCSENEQKVSVFEADLTCTDFRQHDLSMQGASTRR